MTHHEENPLIVMDAGIATEANLAWLKERCCRYLVVSRKRHVEWDDEKLWRTYTMRTDIEAAFHSMKSELGMRPGYHQTTERVEGHLWITLLAYHLVHSIRMRLKEHDIHDSWEIRNLQSLLQNSGWMIGNPTLSPFSG